jgi:hypothetical protein
VPAPEGDDPCVLHVQIDGLRVQLCLNLPLLGGLDLSAGGGG